jgi:hypothetical protein
MAQLGRDGKRGQGTIRSYCVPFQPIRTCTGHHPLKVFLGDHPCIGSSLRIWSDASKERPAGSPQRPGAADDLLALGPRSPPDTCRCRHHLVPRNRGGKPTSEQGEDMLRDPKRSEISVDADRLRHSFNPHSHRRRARSVSIRSQVRQNAVEAEPPATSPWDNLPNQELGGPSTQRLASPHDDAVSPAVRIRLAGRDALYRSGMRRLPRLI